MLLLPSQGVPPIARAQILCLHDFTADRCRQIFANKEVTSKYLQTNELRPMKTRLSLLFSSFYLLGSIVPGWSKLKCQLYLVCFDIVKRFWGLTCDFAEVFEETKNAETIFQGFGGVST
jgi:hypothetical protein